MIERKEGVPTSQGSAGRGRPKVLVVDDEVSIRRIVAVELGSQGFSILEAKDGEEALDILRRERPDLVVLDLLMPGITGWEMLPDLQEQHIPVIILTARDNEAERVRGLNMGAEDYVTKPFSPEELSARVRAVLRRVGRQLSEERVVRTDDVEIDLERRLVRRSGRQVLLSRTEWALLRYLAEHANKVIPGNEILAHVWGAEYASDVHYLRLWVSRLRHKLEENPARPQTIVTIPGVGYQLAVRRPSSLEA